MSSVTLKVRDWQDESWHEVLISESDAATVGQWTLFVRDGVPFRNVTDASDAS